MDLIALLGSPLLGPAVWRPAADALVARGSDVLVVPAPAEAPRRPDDVLAHLLAHIPEDRPLVLVGHSNAGLYLPLVARARRVTAAVYVDAALLPAAGTTTPAPPGALDVLTGLADDDGLLPPWTTWWPDAVLAPLFPDPAVRAEVEREQLRLPLGYFRGELTAPPGWTAAPAAYLALGDTYATERDRAAEWGWPVRTLTGLHLHMLADPVGVADAIEDLLRQPAG